MANAPVGVRRWSYAEPPARDTRFQEFNRMKRYGVPFVIMAILASTNAARGQKDAQPDPAIGRWDLTIEMEGGEHPAWLEVEKSGYSTLVGSFVGRFGSARPIAVVQRRGEEYRFEIPPQWEERKNSLVFEFHVDGDQLEGVTTKGDAEGTWLVRGARAPKLRPVAEIRWGDPIELFNGRDLTGWKPQLDGVENGWEVRDGLLVNAKPGNNLVSERKFRDFRLQAEFRYPAGSNSGLYLRGRYEVQIEDSFGAEENSHRMGAVYGFLVPSFNASRPPGEWQEYDITLVGRQVTVVLNDKRIHDRRSIPGITGGALDSREGDPGPLLIQGDHGPIAFRRVAITPAE